MKIVNLIASNHKEEFDKVLNLRGRRRPYFSKNPSELRSPERISNTEIFLETNLSANRVVRLSRKVLELFGYGEDDLSIEVRANSKKEKRHLRGIIGK